MNKEYLRSSGFLLLIFDIIVIIVLGLWIIFLSGVNSTLAIYIGWYVFIIAGINCVCASTSRSDEMNRKMKHVLQFHDVLLEMATSRGKIDLQFLAQESKLNVPIIYLRISELIKTGKLTGIIIENVYQPTTNFQQEINTLILELQKE